MASYFVGVVNKHDLEKYGLYAAAGYQSIAGFEVEVTTAENPLTLEGNFPVATISIMKFKDEGGASRWYHSDSYQSATPFRLALADTPFLLHVNHSEGQG